MTATIAKLPRKAEKIESIILTPELAATLLEHNQLNRPLRDAHVRRIAMQIVSGKWRFNGDTIKIAEGGDVLDGQHRLWAIIESKKPVETILVRGIEREAFATIDTLRAVRNGADVLALNGAERYRNVMASALQWLIRWQRTDGIAAYRDPRNRVENSDIEAAFAAHPGIIRAVESAVKLKGIVNSSLLAFFYYILTNRNEALAERMLATLRNPAVSMDDPFYRLRQWLLGDRPERRDALMVIALFVKAANAAHQGKKVQNLLWRNQGSRAEEFPVLDVG